MSVLELMKLYVIEDKDYYLVESEFEFVFCTGDCDCHLD